MRTTRDVAVIAPQPGAVSGLLERLLGAPPVVLSPYDLAMGRIPERNWRAVVVEHFTPGASALHPCAAARWLIPQKGLTVVSGDDPAGRRLAAHSRGETFLWSDGDPRADLTAKNINLRWGRLEFDALARGELIRVRLPAETDVYAALSALSCAVGLGMGLEAAVRRIS